MLKHNRRKSLRANIPVGLPFDVEGFRQHLSDRGIHASVRVLSQELKDTRRKIIGIIADLEALDEDLE